MLGLSWMAWTCRDGAFFICIACLLVGMTIWELCSPGGGAAARHARPSTPRAATGCSSRCSAAPIIHLAWLGLLGTPAVGRDGR